MVISQTITPAMIENGRRLLTALDEADVGVRAALWLYNSERGTRALLFALPGFDASGPRAAYEALEKVIRSAKIGLRLDQVGFARSDAPLIGTLRSAVKTTKKAVSGIRFTQNVVDGVVVDDAYIYWLA